eukprot:2744010-Rhodomonas_salina.2
MGWDIGYAGVLIGVEAKQISAYAGDFSCFHAVVVTDTHRHTWTHMNTHGHARTHSTQRMSKWRSRGYARAFDCGDEAQYADHGYELSKWRLETVKMTV